MGNFIMMKLNHCGRILAGSLASFSLLTLGGCLGTQSLLQSAGQSFSKGATAAATVLQKEADSGSEVERRLWIYEAAHVESTVALDNDFAAFVCSGLDNGADAAASLTTVSATAAVVGDLTAKPSDDLGEVLASISKYRKETPAAIKLPAPPDPKGVQNCTKRVLASLAVLKGLGANAAGDRSLLGADADAAIKAVDAVFDAFKKLVLHISQIQDSKVRLQALKDFLADKNVKPGEQGTNDALMAALGECARYIRPAPTEPVEEPSILRAPKDTDIKCTGPLGPDGSVTRLFNRRIASTLVVPYVQYLAAAKKADIAAKEWSESTTPPNNTKPPTPAQQTAHVAQPAVYAEQLATVQSNLKEFDAVRSQSAPGDLAQPIAKAYVNLRRIADDQLTQEEKKQASAAELSLFYNFMKTLVDDLKDVKSKAKDAGEAIDKL